MLQNNRPTGTLTAKSGNIFLLAHWFDGWKGRRRRKPALQYVSQQRGKMFAHKLTGGIAGKRNTANRLSAHRWEEQSRKEPPRDNQPAGILMAATCRSAHRWDGWQRECGQRTSRAMGQQGRPTPPIGSLVGWFPERDTAKKSVHW